MLKFFKKMKKNRKGYTLTELIVVVAILGVLAAVGAPMIMNQIATSRTNADNTNAQTISNTYKIYVAQNSKPASASAAYTAIESILKPMPKISTDGNEYYIDLSSGDVVCEASAPDATRGTYVELKK